METFDQKLQRVLAEEISLENYNPQWPEYFDAEKKKLRAEFPTLLNTRIEHFGSTAIPGLCAKPIVDMLVEIGDMKEACDIIAPTLEAQSYDYFWRSSWDDGKAPHYAWFIKRNGEGKRTHHIHIVEKDFEHWDRLRFKDFLIAMPEIAAEYGALKKKLSFEFPNDRVAYTIAKTDFVRRVTALALKYYENKVE